MWRRILLLWAFPAGFGPILSLITTNSLTTPEWVSLGAGIGLISAATYMGIHWRLKPYAQLVVGGGLVLLGLKLFGWIP